MSKDFKDIGHNVIKGIGALQESHPDLMKSFGSLAAAATKTNALDMKTKELMALAVGITSHCDGCVAYHTKKSLDLGASREEVVETIGLAIYMGVVLQSFMALTPSRHMISFPLIRYINRSVESLYWRK